ncbi:hypothetical protein [Limnohabitans sp. Bal53]|uniref:hypothetical protein n=1 Tax=Limnohabitans sp. Bal53 TaxID=1977910 RepID=UPI0011B1DBA8|nr:hypothetical protein [Limnohabitans sp. Bal53]
MSAMKSCLLMIFMLITGCASVSEFVDSKVIRTIPLKQNVSYADGQTFIKGQRFRLIQLKSGEVGVVLSAAQQMMLITPMQVTTGVEIGKDGCTTGRRFYLQGQDRGSVASSTVDRDLKLWTPSRFCFDLSEIN